MFKFIPLALTVVGAVVFAVFTFKAISAFQVVAFAGTRPEMTGSMSIALYGLLSMFVGSLWLLRSK